MQIYFIDVEGGQSTILVTPNHHSLLIDAGFPADGGWESPAGDPKNARDANRILAAARDASIARIDHLLITHFHQDHDGGVPELAQLIPIREFIDHGTPSESVESNVRGASAAFAAYEKTRRDAKHRVPEVGDRFSIDRATVTVLSTAGAVMSKPAENANVPRSRCTGEAIPAAEPNENPRSTGIVVNFGRFRFLDLGDLTGPALHSLACPENKVGRVSVYLVAHHGGADAADAATFEAFRPRVAVMNNGRLKGGARETYELLHRTAELEGVWQLHASDAAGDANFPDTQIANLDEATANWIKLEAKADGSFRIFNGRTGNWTTYPAHLKLE